MRGPWVFLAAFGLMVAFRVSAQDVPAQGLVPFTMKVPVNEVIVPFHVTDFHGTPLADLTLSDLRVRDNGKPPRELISLEALHDLPVRVGFVMDASTSAHPDLARDQQIAWMYVTNFMDASRDQAFVMRFDGATQLEQEWTSDKGALAAGFRKMRTEHGRVGTAIFDTLYRACLNQFHADGQQSGNFILLFSDGEDNVSHARVEDDVEQCQATNTAVYVFSPEPKERFMSGDGQKTLMELAAKTGGRVFFDDDSSAIRFDMKEIETSLRTQYRLVYKPAELRPDGSFHRIKLDSPTRGGDFVARSGYYAPR